MSSRKLSLVREVARRWSKRVNTVVSPKACEGIAHLGAFRFLRSPLPPPQMKPTYQLPGPGGTALLEKRTWNE